MDDPFDIRLYPQPWITFSVVGSTLIQNRTAYGDVEWSLKSALDSTLNGLTDWVMSGMGYESYEDFVDNNYHGGDISETDFQIIQSLPDTPNPLSISDTSNLIERLDAIADSYTAEYTPKPTPGPWARAERDQLFNWMLSQIRRYADVDPVSQHEYIAYNLAPIYTVMRGVQGKAEMSAAEIALRLSEDQPEEGLQMRVPNPVNLPPTQRDFDVLEVRLIRELPDGSPEALGITVMLDKQLHEGGRSRLIK